FGSWTLIDDTAVFLFAGNLENLNTDSSSLTYFTDNQIEFNTATEHTTFRILNSFPYVERVVTEVVGGEVNDMDVSTTVRAATDTLTADGGINISITGSNPPFEVALSPSDSFIPLSIAQDQFTNSTGVFGTLYSGAYNPVARDSAGFERFLDIVVLTEDNSSIIENYGSKYHFQFNSSDPYRIDILERDYIGSSTQINEAGARPFTFSQHAEGQEVHDIGVISSTCNLELICTTFRQYEEFVNADDGQYLIRLSKSGITKGQWFLLPENIEEQLYTTPYPITLQGIDRLAQLKNEKWESIFFIGNNARLIDVLNTCISSLNFNQGYRIAVNISEDSHTGGSTITPLHETYIDTKIFEGKTFLEVVEEILSSLEAQLRSWNGYWYIIRTEELTSGSLVSYKQYDYDLTYESSSTFDPVINFVAADQSNGWRFAGVNSQIYEAQYKNINIDVLLLKNENGLAGNFDFGPWSNHATGFGAFNWSNDQVDIQVSRVSSENYIQRTGTFKHKPADFVKLECDINTRLVDLQNNAFDIDKSLEFRGPYFPIKWSLSVGGLYLDTSGNWVSSETINQLFIKETDASVKLKVFRRLYGSNDVAQNYVLKIYGASIFESDLQYSSQSTLLTGIRGISTTNINSGARRIIKLETVSGNDIDMYYYEFQEDASTQDDINRIKPTDSSTHKWVLINQWHYDHGPWDGDALYGAVTETTISNVVFDIYQNGLPTPEKLTITRTGSDKNSRSIDLPLNIADLVNLSGGEAILENYLKLSDGTPTNLWTYGTHTQSLAEHKARQMQQLYRNTRTRVNSNIVSDVDIEPISVLVNANDSNRTYLPIGMTFDYKNTSRYEGEVVEYTSDNIEEVRDFDSSDFDTNDFS
ncbi:MAG: hypothetical protein AAF391_07510, partial [Bacteroidota bacterium]